MAQKAVPLATRVTVRCEVPDTPALHSTRPITAQDLPVVLIHAWAESMRAFDVVVELLDPAVPVIRFDQRGHGASDKPNDGYDLQHFVGDVIALLDALDISSAMLVGASSGGYVAQQVAVDVPDRVAGLVLVGAPRSLRRVPAFLEELTTLTDPVDPSWARSFVDGFTLARPVSEQYVRARVDDVLQCPVRSLVGTLVGLSRATPPTDDGTISAPTTIMWGDRDDLLPQADAELLQRAIAEAELIRCPDTGHLVLWEQPQLVAHAVLRLWHRVR